MNSRKSSGSLGDPGPNAHTDEEGAIAEVIGLTDLAIVLPLIACICYRLEP